MRYYKIVIGGDLIFTSFANGKSDPGALNIELDIPVAPFATPMGGSIVRVWGIPLQQISQASNLNGKSIEIYGGMQKGLPLANPAQAGLLVKGTIFPAFGNWIGADMTLDLILAPPFGSNAKPANLVHNWQKGTTLASAIASTLSTAFPDYKANIKISDNLKLPQDDVGFYQTIGQYSEYLKAVSQKILGSTNYPGVNVVLNGGRIDVYDASEPAASEPKQISFEDMIGQPTWLGLNTIQIKTVMRADVAIGDKLMLPPAIATTSAQSFSQFRSRSAFQGKFLVQQMRHIGNFRQPDAASWNTTIDVVSLDQAA